MKKTQIPHGDDKLVCPMHKVSCGEVCHKCPWWQQLRGTNPNTGHEVDEWGCAVAFLPILLIEASRQVREGAAATESMRNEMVMIAKVQEQAAVGATNTARDAISQIMDRLIHADPTRYVNPRYQAIELTDK